MNGKLMAEATLNRDFLETRHRLLDIAAALDRLDRAPNRERLGDDPRLAMIRKAVETLAEDTPGRTGRVQMVFSIPYDRPGTQTLSNRHADRPCNESCAGWSLACLEDCKWCGCRSKYSRFRIREGKSGRRR